LQFADVSENIEPESIRPMGNYAVAINWPDGFSQIAPYDQLQALERLVDVPEPGTSLGMETSEDAHERTPPSESLGNLSGAAAILQHARSLKSQTNGSNGL
jgi:hypothetical protein